ncbi:hypothetical protein ES703_122872 [subsurface metagenome]
MKKKVFSIFFVLVLVLSFSLVTAVPAGAADPGTLLSATGEWDVPKKANEDRIVVEVPAGTTLGQITSIAWSEYLIQGYPPHVDIILDLGEEVEDALVFEYAYNFMSHYEGASMPYGAITGAWFQTFSDDGEGPAIIDNDAFAWLSSRASGAPGSPDFISGTLAEWKDGGIVGGLGIDANTPVLRLEIEVDNWQVDSEALVDNIDVFIGSVAIDLEATILSVPDIVAISVDTPSIDFGDLLPGATSAPFVITVSNVGSVAVDITTSVTGDFFIANLYLGEELATAYVDSIAVEGSIEPSATVEVPSDQSAGKITGSLTFEAKASP